MRASRERSPIRRRALAGALVGGLLVGGGAAGVLHEPGRWLSPGTAVAAAAKSGGPAPASAGASAPRPAAAARAASATESVRARTPARAATARAAQDERVTYHYNALGRRDPFRPLIGGGFIGADVGGDAPPDIGGLRVVGIVWGAEDKFALVEDPRGSSRVLRRGDKVMNGQVEALKRDALIVKLTVDGQTHLVTIPLTRKGDESDENHH